MSWRFIFAILVVAAGASVWGGLQLGDWLVAYGPQATVTPEKSDIATVAVLDANGNPFLAQPPQPLGDGRMAVPEPPAGVDWEIPEKAIDDIKANNVIAVATTAITMVEAEQIAAASSGHKLTGIADVGDLMRRGPGPTGGPLQPIDAPVLGDG